MTFAYFKVAAHVPNTLVSLGIILEWFGSSYACLNWTLVLWNCLDLSGLMTKLVVHNEYKKDMYCDDIGLCAKS